MNTVTVLTIATVTLFCGFGLGVISMLLYQDPDSARIQKIELNKWQIGCYNGKWAVLTNVNGGLRILGQSHDTLREAIDGVPHG